VALKGELEELLERNHERDPPSLAHQMSTAVAKIRRVLSAKASLRLPDVPADSWRDIATVAYVLNTTPYGVERRGYQQPEVLGMLDRLITLMDHAGLVPPDLLAAKRHTPAPSPVLSDAARSVLLAYYLQEEVGPLC
jgi:hypothetical protein